MALKDEETQQKRRTNWAFAHNNNGEGETAHAENDLRKWISMQSSEFLT